MISRITIEGLKCFDKEKLELKPFTLLSGMNSAGKSTFIQAILLTIQNVTDKGTSPLNGKLVALGDYSEARNFITNAKTIHIALEDSTEKVSINIAPDRDREDVKCIFDPEIGDLNKNSFTQKLDYTAGCIHYISSDRIGIQDLYDKNYNKHESFGIKGEYALDYYNKAKTNLLPDELIKDKSISKTLEGQLNYWLKYVLNCELITEDVKGTDKIKTSYRYNKSSRAVRPKNIGTGLSFVISIMIAGLSSNIGDLIIIENPEIHLHPKAQSRLTEFLAFLANNGVQFIIETHSDHIFNGIRKAVKKEVINKEDVSIYFFGINDKLLSNPIKIDLTNDGQIINHQIGLFDQFDDDLDELLGL